MQQVKVRRRRIAAVLAASALAAGIVAAIAAPGGENAPEPGPAGRVRPALTVAGTVPERAEWPRLLPATGNISAWQEAVISAEISNYRLTAVDADVGDRVRKGQLLARIAEDTVAAELAQSTAAQAEAQAALQEARANAERARQLHGSGAMSDQQIRQYLSAEQTAAARLQAARARVQADRVRQAQTRVLAPDDGIVSARTATVGSLAQSGEPLFRLIRGGRLEWRAEVPEAALGRLVPGTPATLTGPDGAMVRGRVRTVAPTVDPGTRNGIVHVDLQPAAEGGAVLAGMFARGEFELGRDSVLTLPQSAVLLREGFAYVFRLEGPGEGGEARVAQAKVKIGRRVGERIEIADGLAADTRVVAQGVGFLADGDTVRVADAARTPGTAAR
ncbi:efflux RND transporter periplasmic adaptor subunit [Thauera sinica]|uniref:efflux RND transporter periplasmic adaptor subunit n=1 Tax=Thauera sp. K11 TaxID=2005884 RepID=UPI001E42A776|nr:efflux RND transporter periplasmic adaptor subunit [Thauera sp. K11]